MKTFTIVLLVILVILIVACVALYFVGKKQKRNRQISRHNLMQLHRLFPSWLSIKVV